ncbi:MAG: PAS domain S-box protein [Deltaproteobacteria bacterium]|nr:PAS domain S-box protein [Deltaproteobacteria bacterium]
MYLCSQIRRLSRLLLPATLFFRFALLPSIVCAATGTGTGMDGLRISSSFAWAVVVLDGLVLSVAIAFFLFNGRLRKEVDRERKELHLEEKKFQTVFENYQQLCWLLDPGGIVLAVNRQALATAGCSEEQIPGRPFPETPWWSHSAAEQKKLRRALDDIVAGRDAVRFDTVHVDSEQNVLFLDFFLNSIKNTEGELLYILAQGYDVTALRHDRQLYHSLFANTPEPVLLLKNGLIVDCNHNLLQLFQCRRQQLIGRQPVDLLPVSPADGNGIGIAQATEEAVRTGMQTVKGQARRFDGTFFAAELTIIPLDIGGTAYVQMIVKDLTLAKQTHRELVMAKYAFDHSTLPITWYVVGNTLKQCRFFYVNDAACKAAGYSREEFLNLSIADLSLVWSEENYRQILDGIRRQGAVTYETRIRHRDGHEIPIEMNTSYFKLENREYIFVISEEISQRKRLEGELRQAQKMEAIGTLAGGVAHDFNNILTAIFGYTELALYKVTADSELRRPLEQVRKAAERARSLVQQILAFSRKTGEEQHPLEIGPIVGEALKLLRSSIPTTISIESSIESKGLVMADSTQIHQIVMNLCTNGYQAMREHGGILSIRVADVECSGERLAPDIDLPPGSYVQLTVRDTGTGMDNETRKRIFDPYFTTKDIGEGTGLGLAVVHGIVRGYRGTIMVESHPGRGAVFTVYLPRLAPDNARELQNEAGGKFAGGTERIMFVDDEEQIVEMSRQMLTQFGYTVTTFTSSTKALDHFFADPQGIDLVITDLTMPAMSGKQLASSILADRPDLPIILCTGYSEDMNQNLATEMGIRRFVQKPLIMRDLLQTIRTVLDEKRPG